MPTDSNTSRPSQDITIQGETFTIPAPYAEGHTLNANEASAVNQLFAENVRNNSAARIKAALKEHAEANGGSEDGFSVDTAMVDGAEEGTKVSLRDAILQYAESYKFGERRAAAAREPVDPTQREAFRIARDAVTEALKSQNLKRAELADGQFDDAVAEYAKDPDVQKEAKRRVDARSKIGTAGLNLGALTRKAPETQPEAETVQA